ncbi:SOS response-associated peptidase [Isoptericola sp. NEAU-Y5]|uniref:Abasic site processing protein n=1 Tax=Isoptericola luteus TaxID=2879484 RepID=A0ABS7ZBC2_9MICO|nr:SOS response-associated peptidase [Isoptericola sp. NEAU-Y5]MCA5892337.1 SOS response-associated peptidase [Isoptericola sp. NEAU-Y5]
MCGRYASFRDAQDIADDLAVADIADDARLLPPSWNVAPTDPVRIVVERPQRIDGRNTGEITRSLRLARWGLVPSWAKDPGIGARMINARSETLLDKSAFAKPLGVRRCLLPADGYYEWRKLTLPDGAPARAGSTSKVPKQPYWIHPAEGGVAALAGLYEFWRDRSKADDDPDRWLVSATVITTAASKDLERIHDRMPVILPADAWDAWLDPAVGAEEAMSIVGGPQVGMATRPVGDAVGSVQNNRPSLIEPDPDPRDPDVVAVGGP